MCNAKGVDLHPTVHLFLYALIFLAIKSSDGHTVILEWVGLGKFIWGEDWEQLKNMFQGKGMANAKVLWQEGLGMMVGLQEMVWLQTCEVKEMAGDVGRSQCI